jgi:hypothetical protein
MGVVISVSAVPVTGVAVAGASAVAVTAVAVGTGCGGGVVGTAEGLHPERLHNIVRQAIAVAFLTIMDCYLSNDRQNHGGNPRVKDFP